MLLSSYLIALIKMCEAIPEARRGCWWCHWLLFAQLSECCVHNCPNHFIKTNWSWINMLRGCACGCVSIRHKHETYYKVIIIRSTEQCTNLQNLSTIWISTQNILQVVNEGRCCCPEGSPKQSSRKKHSSMRNQDYSQLDPGSKGSHSVGVKAIYQYYLWKSLLRYPNWSWQEIQYDVWGRRDFFLMHGPDFTQHYPWIF